MIPQRGGLPHSDIHGSKPARGSPWLFAACHVLHRLLVPRHPPNALIALDTQMQTWSGPQPLSPCTGTIIPLTVRSDNIFKLHSKHSYSAHYTTPLNTAAPIDWTTLDATNRQHRDPFRSDRRQSPRRTSQTSPETQQCQAKTNRVVLRAQRRTRTRFTKQKNTAARPSGPAPTRRPTATPRFRGHADDHRWKTSTHHAQARLQTRPASRMETIGFEPMTPCLQSRCSTN